MILFFTGTGNSRFVANRIAKALEEPLIDLSARIKDSDYSAIQSETPWVVVTPTYAWRIPRVVEDILSRTSLEGSKDVYFVMTCGDDIGNAEKYLRIFCKEKGMNFKGVKAVIMPENYIAMFNAPGEKEARAIIEKAYPVIDLISECIKKRETILEPVGIIGRIESSIINTSFYAMCIKDRAFLSTDNCNGCGLCEMLCPMNNISISEGRPVWHGNCTHCMACICHCPKEAIEYGKKSIGKPRYKCPDPNANI